MIINQNKCVSKSCYDIYNAHTINEMRQASHNEKKTGAKKMCRLIFKSI